MDLGRVVMTEKLENKYQTLLKISILVRRSLLCLAFLENILTWRRDVQLMNCTLQGEAWSLHFEQADPCDCPK